MPALRVVREVLVGDATHGGDHQVGGKHGANGGDPRGAKHARRKEFEAGGARLGGKQRLRRGKDAGHRDHAVGPGAGNDIRIDVGGYQKPAANVMEPLDGFQRQDGAGAHQDPGRGLLDGDLDGAERIRRVERDLDRRHAAVDQHADDIVRFLGPHAAQDRDQRTLHRGEWDNAHSNTPKRFRGHRKAATDRILGPD